MTPTLTEYVWAAVGDRARPLLTYYGRAQRVGLSGATLENWAAKIANYLRDEAGLLPGDAVTVDLPEHWQSAAVLLGTWWAGLQVAVPSDADSLARVVFTSVDRLDDYPEADELVVVPLDPFGGRVPDLPAFVNDFGDTVRPHGDHFSPGGAGEARPGQQVEAVLAAARAAAQADGVQSGMRVLSTRSWHSGDDIVANLLGPLTAGAAVVWADRNDAPDLATLAATEHTDLALTDP